MNYHPQFAYAPAHMVDPRPMLHHQHSHPQMMESYMHPHAHMDYSDFPHHASLHDEYEDSPEILSRPRLTKEQVEVLENQFQAHPKPNSNVKRQLAIQTKLTLPRVANWFQNRRAKAKQQKKQEEFEIMQAMNQASGKDNTESEKPAHPFPQSATSEKSPESNGSPDSNSAELEDQKPQPSSASATASSSTAAPISRTTSAQEASWQSLQRALAAAEAARPQYSMDDSLVNNSTLESPLVSEMTSSNDSSQFPSSTSDWTNASSIEWVSSSHSDQPFDFSGLDMSSMTSEQFASSDPHIVFHPSPETVSEPGSEEWVSNMKTPTMPPPQSQIVDNQLPHDMPLPSYPHSRRGSSSEDLTIGVGNIGLDRGNSTPTGMLSPDSTGFPKPDSSIDIAARRKRPRPAMLGTAALRSRSYGAPPTLSPTVRYSSSPVHPLRHVKSTGNSLNVHYGGIRKPTPAQRSPLNISTFAEAEALSAVMAATPSLECTSAGPAPNTPLSSEEHAGIPIPAAIDEQSEVSNEYYQLVSNMQLNVSSPPATPLKAEYFAHSQFSMPPPMSAPPQYAIFPDYTPPYSAGPLTAGSWSDAPLASPEHTSFNQAMNMTQPSYISSMMQEYGHVPNFSQPFGYGSELKSESQRATEFFIQEFPQQKEAHAHAAQQLAQQKPKNYVFANATANDFSE